MSWRRFPVLIAVALVTAGCTRGSEPVVVGAVYPLSGSQGPGGVDEYRGVVLAADMANRAGGVWGRRLELRAIDVAGSDAAPAAIRLLAQDGVRFVLGSYGSTISRPAAEESARRGLLYWETGAVGEMTGAEAGRLVFRAAPAGGVLGRNAVSFVADTLAPILERDPDSLRWAVANVDDVYGDAVAGGALDEIARRGLTLAGAFPYDVARVDHADLAGAIGSARPDVLFVSAYLEDGVGLRREMVRQGIPLVASIGTSSSYCHPEFGAALGADAVGLFASDKPDAGALDPEGLHPAARSLLARVQAEYRDRHGGDMSAAALAGFSAAWALFTEVMPEATAPTPEDVGRAALQVDLPRGSLPNGSGLSFQPPGGVEPGANLRAATVIWEWVAPGQRAVVWPAEYATAPVDPVEIAP